MTIFQVTVNLSDAIPAQAAILTTIRNNVTVLTDPANAQALLSITRIA